MRILILGGAGMVGRKLAERLVQDGHLGGKPIQSLTLYDIVEAGAPEAGFPVRVETGDLPAPGEAERLLADRPDVVFHLAAIVSGQAERCHACSGHVDRGDPRLLRVREGVHREGRPPGEPASR